MSREIETKERPDSYIFEGRGRTRSSIDVRAESYQGPNLFSPLGHEHRWALRPHCIAIQYDTVSPPGPCFYSLSAFLEGRGASTVAYPGTCLADRMPEAVPSTCAMTKARNSTTRARAPWHYSPRRHKKPHRLRYQTLARSNTGQNGVPRGGL